MGSMPAQRLQVFHDRVQLVGWQLALGERGHGSDAVSDLELHQESRQRLVVDRRREGTTTRMKILLGQRSVHSPLYIVRRAKTMPKGAFDFPGGFL